MTARVAAPLAPSSLSLRGEAIVPGDPRFDAARAVWNGMIDRRPAIIARCAGVADVRAALAHARERALTVAVRGGGHNVTGNAVCDGGLVVDLSLMKGIRVDPRRRVVRCDAGVNWGELYHETQAHGLALTGGIVTTTGVAGLTLGGGIGWLMRAHGLTIDELISADVVTVDGELVVASEAEDADLFWALRGGGGNFGIVTSFEFRLHDLGPTVMAGGVLYPAAEAKDVLRRYREVVGAASDRVATIFSLRRVLRSPAFPAHLHGEPVIAMNICYLGRPEQADRELAPLRRLGTVLLDRVAQMPFLALQGAFDASVPWGLRYYWKSHYLAELTDGAIDVLVEQSWRPGSPWSYTIVFHMGGAIARVTDDATPFNGRGAAFAVNVNGAWPDPSEDDREVADVRASFEALAPHATGATYVNFLGSDGADRVRAAYSAGHLERLREIKARYDPENVLRLNQNIPPA